MIITIFSSNLLSIIRTYLIQRAQ